MCSVPGVPMYVLRYVIQNVYSWIIILAIPWHVSSASTPAPECGIWGL